MPVHNIGYFRYIECTYLVEDGQPGGDVTVWDEIRFPFDPALQASEGATVEHSEAVTTQRIEERYSTRCQRSGYRHDNQSHGRLLATIPVGAMGVARDNPVQAKSSASSV